ncbi:MAG: primosomal protein N' [Elusimicrobiota bacterium]
MTPNQKFASIILPLPLEKTFHYAIPAHLADKAVRGARVTVPFGPKLLTGYIQEVLAETHIEKIRPIINVVDAGPVVSEELFGLAEWLSYRYVCSLGEALGAIVSPAVRPMKRAFTRRAEPPVDVARTPKPELKPAQRDAVKTITDKLDKRESAVFLLHGVTSSGKTEVYLAAIEKTLAAGRSAIFLVPEISLTPQFIGIMQHRFPGVLGVWHSRLSGGEKYDTWEAALGGKIKIMLGARSAVFAPFANLGLIIMDEEHENSYKQDQKPTYMTSEVVVKRAKLNNAVAILGSATPSLESYYKTEKGEYTLLELPERIDEAGFPPVEIIDMRKQGKKIKIISEELKGSLTKTLARREQAIIFLNRRGFAPWIMCQDCGKVWECPSCSVSLVYHREPEGLSCHYCGHTEPWPGICPSCKKNNLSIFGVGTQKVEQELKKVYPQGRVFRLDRDTAAKKGAVKQVYEDFKNENCDILLGTQIVAKGFDFPRVTLVGVIDADTSLYLPDFRSAEKTFQLMAQVAGRSGRSRLGGKVIIQSRHPDHYSLLAAEKHDYKRFYTQEMIYRGQLNYPPFSSLANLLIRGKKEEKAQEAAQTIADFLAKWRDSKNEKMDILGPSQASRYKLSNNYRWQIMLKGKEDVLLRAGHALKDSAMPSGILMTFDMDTQDTL